MNQGRRVEQSSGHDVEGTGVVGRLDQDGLQRQRVAADQRVRQMLGLAVGGDREVDLVHLARHGQVAVYLDDQHRPLLFPARGQCPQREQRK